MFHKRNMLKLVASQYEECYPNEVFTPSVNPCNTCDVRGYCPEYSGPGCDCAPGLFRNSYGACVPPEGCDGPYNTNYNKKVIPPSCPGRYEEYRSCGPACPPACEKHTTPCTEQCVSGCFCAEGYVRSKRGECVRPSQCEQTYPPPVPRPVCGPDEEYTECGTPCPPTCGSRCPVCALQCIKGCFCRRGYVRRDGRCVDPQECTVPQIPPPLQCGANEIFLDCGSACPPTCQNKQQTCTLQCVRGCFCSKGYFRKNGVCVPPQACNENPPPPSFPNPGPVTPRRYSPYPNPPLPAPVKPAFSFKPLPVPVKPAYPSPPLPVPGGSAYPSPPRGPVVPPVPVGIPVKASPPPAIPPLSGGCPNRNSCNKHCRSIGSSIGFCIEPPNFTKCNCM